MAAIDNTYIQATDEAQVIELFLKRFSVTTSDSQYDLLEKIDRIDYVSQDLKQYFKLNVLIDKAEQHQYIRFMSKLIEMRESLEIATGQISMQDIQLAGRTFARKTQDPIGTF
jgi:hypothetical protein